MEFPDDLKYSKDHEWIRVDADGTTATIGITDFAQSELGDIVFVELEDVDESVEQNGSFGSVEAVKTVSELYMPVSGTITEHNEALEDAPEKVNEDAYGEGWLIKISMSNPAELDALMSAAEYKSSVGK